MPTANYFTEDGVITGQETGGTSSDFLTDALGSVTATVDQNQTVVNTYRYKPYGATLSSSGVGDEPRIRWQNQILDAAGLHSKAVYRRRQQVYFVFEDSILTRSHQAPTTPTETNPTSSRQRACVSSKPKIKIGEKREKTEYSPKKHGLEILCAAELWFDCDFTCEDSSCPMSIPQWLSGTEFTNFVGVDMQKGRIDYYLDHSDGDQATPCLLSNIEDNKSPRRLDDGYHFHWRGLDCLGYYSFPKVVPLDCATTFQRATVGFVLFEPGIGKIGIDHTITTCCHCGPEPNSPPASKASCTSWHWSLIIDEQGKCKTNIR